ncbi:M48 family metalloprotease [Aquabacterium sp. OR-4]|uniref:M48 family metalloprotease n=1 Tax=Aquabacterium sp. OR-4 TaxID=2978127 RepID=UPI0021B2E7FE|nr:M48 family metalloprotease [Aquabacterium sp. OR-4]MDT7838299.1 M48 family metalloprotease [Aquabacterium sp. OR-4]
MRRWFLLLSWMFCSQAWCEGIGEVLERSQQLRLAGFAVADPALPSVQRLHESFAQLTARLELPRPVSLRVVDGPVLAETLHGHVIVVSERLGRLSEGERLFVLAHELGHVSLNHWRQMTRLYQAWLPGDLVQAESDAVAPMLGRDASALAHHQEFAADAFALRIIQPLGHSVQEARAVFMQMGVYNDTATHPGTRKRLGWLRAAERGELPPEPPEPMAHLQPGQGRTAVSR